MAIDDFPNNSSTSGLLTVGGTADGTINVAGDEDWFKIYLNAGQTYLLGLEGARSGAGTLGAVSGAPFLSLYSPSGGLINSVTSGAPNREPMMSFMPQESDYYYVAASEPVDHSIGTYRLSASLAQPDDFASNVSTTGVLVVGGTASGSIEQAHDSDWFKVYLASNTTYVLTLENTGSGGGTSSSEASAPRLALLPYSGSGSQSQDSDSTWNKSVLTFTPVIPGFYFLEAKGADNDISGGYQVRADVVSAQPTVITMAGITYSGDLRVDSLLREAVDWNYLLPARTTLFYTFDTSVVAQTEGVVMAFNAAQRAAAIEILNHAASVTGISFLETGSADSADIHFAGYDYPDPEVGGEMRPSESWTSGSYGVLTSYSAEAFVLLDMVEWAPFNASPTPGSESYQFLLHLIGHVLGLGHPSSRFQFPAGQDITNYTVMANSPGHEFKSTFLPYDQLALRWIYGGDGLRSNYGLNSVHGPSIDLTPTDIASPAVLIFSPADEARDVVTNSNIVLTFSEPIQRGPGVISVVSTSSGALIESFAMDSAAVTILGSTLTINPSSNLVGGKDYQVLIPAGAVKDVAGNSSAEIGSYNFKVAPPVWPSFTVPGTMGVDYVVPAAGNSYMGGAGADVYVISPSTLSKALVANVVDTEGADAIQLVDATVITDTTFYADAVQLILSTGAVVQIVNASRFSYQVGANALAGDAATPLTYAQFAGALGGSLPVESASITSHAVITVPTSFNAAPTFAPAEAGASVSVSGTLGNDVAVVSAGHNYLGGAGDDIYIISRHTLSGQVTATITDTEGSDVIQLADSTVIATSSFLSDAVQLTLSTGARVQVLGASKFSFQVGANAPGGDIAPSLSYAQFAAALGTSVPAAGVAASSGTPGYVVPGNGSQVLGGAGAPPLKLSGIADTAAGTWMIDMGPDLP